MTPYEEIEIAIDYTSTECCNSCSASCEYIKCNMFCNVRNAVLYGLAKGKPKWHDIRKCPNDLPDNGMRVLVKNKSSREYDVACLCRNKCGSDFWSYERFTSYVSDNYVIAWCELPKFEED